MAQNTETPPREKARVHIPGLCWIPEPDSPIRCSEHENHTNENHLDVFTGREWPRYEGEHQ